MSEFSPLPPIISLFRDLPLDERINKRWEEKQSRIKLPMLFVSNLVVTNIRYGRMFNDEEKPETEVA